MKLKVVGKYDYNDWMKVGQEVEIDKVKVSDSASGIMFRVVGIWKTPKWFDLGWFVELDDWHKIHGYAKIFSS